MPIDVTPLTLRKKDIDWSHLRKGVDPKRWEDIEPVIDKLTPKQKIRLVEQTTDSVSVSKGLWDTEAAFRAINEYGVPAVLAIARYGYPATLAIADHKERALRSITKYGKPAAVAIARLGESAAYAIDEHGRPALKLITEYGNTAAGAIDCCGEPAIQAIKRHKYAASSAIAFYGKPALKIYLATSDTRSANKELEKYRQSLKNR